MESVIAKLLQDFEQGKMNRRQLIWSLSVAAAAAAAAAGMAPEARAAGKPLEALYVNHISYQVNDYKKVRDFYVDLLGMKITEDDGKEQCRLVFGNNILIPRSRAKGGPARVDHIAYTITNWEAEKEGLEAELKRRKLEYTGSAKTSFQVKDPEGMGVQFGGLHLDTNRHSYARGEVRAGFLSSSFGGFSRPLRGDCVGGHFRNCPLGSKRFPR